MDELHDFAENLLRGQTEDSNDAPSVFGGDFTHRVRQMPEGLVFVITGPPVGQIPVCQQMLGSPEAEHQRYRILATANGDPQAEHRLPSQALLEEPYLQTSSITIDRDESEAVDALEWAKGVLDQIQQLQPRLDESKQLRVCISGIDALVETFESGFVLEVLQVVATMAMQFRGQVHLHVRDHPSFAATLRDGLADMVVCVREWDGIYEVQYRLEEEKSNWLEISDDYSYSRMVSDIENHHRQDLD